MKRNGVFLLFILSLVAGCATRPQQVVMWNLNGAVPPGYITLKRPDGSTTGVNGLNVQRFQRAKDRIASAAGVSTQINAVLSEATEPNAFSTTKDGVYIIGITISMLNLIGPDDDAMGQLVGHELAHQVKMHGEARKSRESVRQGASNILGLALSLAGVSGGGTIADLGTQAVASAYSRDEEREADIVGFGYAKTAGYDPQGAVRLYQLLEKAGSSGGIPFLSTHPTSPERVENMKKLVAGSAP
jgi:predicted Zn-dependent protease